MLDRKYSKVRIDEELRLLATAKTHFAGGTPVAQPASANQAVVGAALPNVDEDGITAGAFITRAARRTAVTQIQELRVLTNEMRLVLVNNGLMKGAA